MLKDLIICSLCAEHYDWDKTQSNRCESCLEKVDEHKARMTQPYDASGDPLGLWAGDVTISKYLASELTSFFILFQHMLRTHPKRKQYLQHGPRSQAMAELILDQLPSAEDSIKNLKLGLAKMKAERETHAE